MKNNTSKYSLMKQKMKYAGSSAIAGLMALYSTGCASMNVRPVIGVSGTNESGLEARAGIAFTGDASENPEYHGGFGRETAQTLLGPFHVYRAKDGKWFPEFKEHPYRTTGMTLLYIGAAAAASGGSSGGSSSAPADNTTNPTKPDNKTNPSDPSPRDGGSDGGF